MTKTKRHLGQNFLYDLNILEKMIQVARLSQGDTVVEIGPGPGRLTKLLAQRAKKVIAIEIDNELYEQLKVNFLVQNNVELIHGDALKFPFESIGDFKVVGNIPYYITTPLIFKLLEEKKRLKTMTLTIQKEVAERIVAGPGGKDYSIVYAA
jgi:16S rRNA (adenine1518-N6/adenine1519-N6)-dimethyltransferase